MKFKINQLISIKFDTNNEIPYYQDHGFHKNLPDDVNFYPIEMDDRFIVLIGDGYGIMEKHGLSLDGSYGNGSISILRKDFDESEMEKLEIIIGKNKTILFGFRL
jgi:hypothetical protein